MQPPPPGPYGTEKKRGPARVQPVVQSMFLILLWLILFPIPVHSMNGSKKRAYARLKSILYGIDLLAGYN